MSKLHEFKLDPTSPLDGMSQEYEGVRINEVTDKSLVSIATPKGEDKNLKKAISKHYQCDLPVVGQSTVSSDGKAVFLGMQRDQMFVFFDYETSNPVETVIKNLGATGYYTDQSDSWVMLQISGVQSRKALARICMLDLHADVFTEGSVARTAMEHMGTIIFHEGQDSFIIFTARSSAKSLLHAVETSIKNIE